MNCIPIGLRVFDNKQDILNAYCLPANRTRQCSATESSTMVSVVATGVDDNDDEHDHPIQIEDFDRMCRELFWEVEQTLIMHKLSKDYFGFRVFWIQALPQILMTTTIAIVGFVQYGQYGSSNSTLLLVDEAGYADDARRQQWLALSVGTLGLLSSFLTCLSLNTRYQSKRDVHSMAERTLAKVCQSVRFPERIPGAGGVENEREKLFEHLNRQKAIFMSITCTSSHIPPRIEQAFHDLKHAMDMKPYTFRAIQYERVYYALWKLFTKRSMRHCNFLWPLAIPEINISSNVIGKIIDDEYEKYNQGLIEARRRSSSSIGGKRRSRGSRGGNRVPGGDGDEEEQTFNMSELTFNRSEQTFIRSEQTFNRSEQTMSTEEERRLLALSTKTSPSIDTEP